MKLEKYRLYFLVPYNISSIQKGIQCGHAALEYAYKFGNNQEYIDFIEKDKTWIILNGGTSNHSYNDSIAEPLTIEEENPYILSNADNPIGSMESHWNTLNDFGIKSTFFLEPDANNMMTSICFLVPNQVFNKDDYPNFMSWVATLELATADIIDFKKIHYLGSDETTLYKKKYEEWVNLLGGDTNAKLRIFLNQFKLA